MPHLPREHSHFRRYSQAGRLLVLLAAAAALAPAESDVHRVTAVRFWSLGELTRVAIETDGDFQVLTDHLSNPERIFFDLTGTRPAIGKKLITVIPVGDKVIQQIRVAEPRSNVTRVVLDLTGPAQATTSRLDNPSRLIIEVRQSSGSSESAEIEPPKPPAAIDAPKTAERRSFNPPRTVAPESKQPEVALVEPPLVETPSASAAGLSAKLASASYRGISTPPPAAAQAKLASNSVQPQPEPVAKGSASDGSEISRRSLSTPTGGNALPAKHSSLGERSMVRVLGLKIGRIVLDPGHGGHDTGTVGPEGLREKDLVLDVAKRLGALIEERMGSEVIFTRTDDTFIPLERRTEIANDAKADLFLSIHANSSPVRSAAGVETYYLSFTTSKTALDLAARENAGSQETVYDLQDLLQKIALNDKIGESRDFATRVQSSLFSLSAKSNSHAKDRGVRKAPFVVLIGANMPSVLAEVGFISNAHDEGTMKRPEYRERIAEALYKGLSGYASTLSHFQVAQRDATSTR